MNSKLLERRIMLSLILSAGLVGCAEAPGGYRIVTTPGPHGMTRVVANESGMALSNGAAHACRPPRPRYRLVTTPGPRGTTRAERVRETDNSSGRQAEPSCK